MRIRVLRCRKGDRDFGISGVLSKGWKQIFIFLWGLEIDISIIAKDWMVRKDKSNGYQVYGKNPKYVTREPILFCFPKDKSVVSKKMRTNGLQ